MKNVEVGAQSSPILGGVVRRNSEESIATYLSERSPVHLKKNEKRLLGTTICEVLIPRSHFRAFRKKKR
jgi:DNA recombination-dependent growth factor C